MAQLICSACGVWNATVDDVTWRITDKNADIGVVESLATSDDVWSEFELVEKRREEWRDRGVYDPMPPPADPVASSITLRCGCAKVTRFDRPT